MLFLVKCWQESRLPVKDLEIVDNQYATSSVWIDWTLVLILYITHPSLNTTVIFAEVVALNHAFSSADTKTNA